MADDKKKGASSLYDNSPSMKKREKESAATAEADMEKGDKPKADSKADAAMKPVESASAKLTQALKDLHKRHESERKDSHGNYREALRQMAARHEKDFAMLIEQHSPREGNANEADGGTSMPGGAAVVDGMEA